LKRVFPFEDIPTLETPHLVLRPLTSEDAESYFELCSDVKTMRLYGLAAHQSKEETLAAIALLDEWFRSGVALRWAIWLKGEPAIIGDAGFWRFDWLRNRGEVGAKIHPDYARQGFMSEAAARSIEFGFGELGLHSIEAGVTPANKASLGFVKKLGFRQEGYRKEFSFSTYDKKYLDSYLFSLLESDWKEVRP